MRTKDRENARRKARLSLAYAFTRVYVEGAVEFDGLVHTGFDKDKDSWQNWPKPLGSSWPTKLGPRRSIENAMAISALDIMDAAGPVQVLIGKPLGDVPARELKKPKLSKAE